LSKSDEQQIRDVIETWMQASREGDLDTVMSLMTDDAIFLTPGNPPMRREEFIAASRSLAGKIRIEGQPDILEITVTGDLAICWNRLEMVMTPIGSGASMRRTGSTLSVFRRGEDRRWRLWRDANLLGSASPM
jgi:uncharacterized protein (TIGR02246 family)